HHAYELLGQPVVEFRHPGGEDLALQLGRREVEVQVEATSLERLGQLAGRVGGEHHERASGGLYGPEFGDGHREVAEDLQQQALDLDVGLVDLVDEQDGGLAAPDGGEQRPGQQELLGEHV